MKNTFTIVLFLAFCLLSKPSSGQYLQFSQFHHAPAMLNPAMVGASPDLAVRLHYRNQYQSLSAAYNTTMFSASMPLIYKNISEKRYGGVGIWAMQDRSGAASSLISNGAGLQLAGNLVIAPKHNISLGGQIGYISRALDLGGLSSGGQWVDGVYDPNRPLGAAYQNRQDPVSEFMIGAGFLYYYAPAGLAAQHWLGASIQSSPKATVEGGNSQWLNVHAGAKVFEDAHFIISPSVRYLSRLEAGQVQAGGLVHYKFGDSQTQTEELATQSSTGKVAPKIGLGAWYSVGNAAILSLEFIHSSYIIGLSYDYTVSSLAKSNQTGAPELAIAWKKTIGKRLSEKDTDEDGINDLKDKCPLDSGYTEFDGCPDVDKDGVPDHLDLCPRIAGTIELKGCPDTDGDGIGDSKDICPDLPGSITTSGCPDRDKDGIADKDDLCPDKPGPLLTSGCPDTDKDGLTDNIDQCPEKYGPKRFQGCPDKDYDEVPDHLDKCPETYGSIEKQGCPLNPVVEKYQLADLNPQEAEIVRNAFKNLEFETGKANISGKSYETLDLVTGILKRHPEYRLHIVGHTDNQGNPAANQGLSERRAESVKKYMLERAVVAGQLIVEGYGQTRPVAPNITQENRQKNRRVELRVVR